MNQSIDAIIIDDDPLVHSIWQFCALKKKKQILLFYSAKEFFTHPYVLSSNEVYQKNTEIYVDFNLGNDLKGEIIARNIYNLGFRKIYLMTGEEKTNFSKDSFWLIDIIGKEPPW